MDMLDLKLQNGTNAQKQAQSLPLQTLEAPPQHLLPGGRLIAIRGMQMSETF